MTNLTTKNLTTKRSSPMGTTPTLNPERSRTTRAHSVIDSPIGPLTLVADNGVLAGLYMDGHQHRPDERTFGGRDGQLFDEVTRQLADYFAGRLRAFDVPVALAGTPFQLKVWDALREIPFGETRGYGEIAARIGQPTASRAVGLANGRNPISIIVPCHRVVGSTGKMTGYGGGIARKEYLLALERGLPMF
jgi:methylated-DNA-[protein]-cysteine S-methyltransferase